MPDCSSTNVLKLGKTQFMQYWNIFVGILDVKAPDDDSADLRHSFQQILSVLFNMFLQLYEPILAIRRQDNGECTSMDVLLLWIRSLLEKLHNIINTDVYSLVFQINTNLHKLFLESAEILD